MGEDCTTWPITDINGWVALSLWNFDSTALANHSILLRAQPLKYIGSDRDRLAEQV